MTPVLLGVELRMSCANELENGVQRDRGGELHDEGSRDDGIAGAPRGDVAPQMSGDVFADLPRLSGGLDHASRRAWKQSFELRQHVQPQAITGVDRLRIRTV